MEFNGELWEPSTFIREVMLFFCKVRIHEVFGNPWKGALSLGKQQQVESLEMNEKVMRLNALSLGEPSAFLPGALREVPR